MKNSRPPIPMPFDLRVIDIILLAVLGVTFGCVLYLMYARLRDETSTGTAAKTLAPLNNVHVASTDPLALEKLPKGDGFQLPGSSTTIDEVELKDGYRILLKNQVEASENGIYTYSEATNTLTLAEDYAQNQWLGPTSVRVLYGTQCGREYTLDTSHADGAVVIEEVGAVVQGELKVNALSVATEETDVVLKRDGTEKLRLTSGGAELTGDLKVNTLSVASVDTDVVLKRDGTEKLRLTSGGAEFTGELKVPALVWSEYYQPEQFIFSENRIYTDTYNSTWNAGSGCYRYKLPSSNPSFVDYVWFFKGSGNCGSFSGSLSYFHVPLSDETKVFFQSPYPTIWSYDSVGALIGTNTYITIEVDGSYPNGVLSIRPEANGINTFVDARTGNSAVISVPV